VAGGSLGCLGCVVLPDGRALLVPHWAAHPLIYDPRGDTLIASQVEMAAWGDAPYCWGGMLLPEGKVLLVPHNTAKALLYDPLTDTVEAVTPPEPWGPNAFAGGVLLADGRVYLVPNQELRTWIFDPAARTFQVRDGGGAYSGFWNGGVLLPNGTVITLPGEAPLPEVRVFDPGDGSYAPVSELSTVGPGTWDYFGGVTLPDGRVVFTPKLARDLLVWDPGCGVGFGRDVGLSGFWNGSV
jgi:hypothetical protein